MPFPAAEVAGAPRYRPPRGELQAVYYRARDGSEPVNDFTDRLSVKRQVALDNQIDRLNMHIPLPTRTYRFRTASARPAQDQGEVIHPVEH
jgi:hypothetical protein